MREVAWLLALTRRDAIEEDLPGAAVLAPCSGSSEATRVPTLARWSEVRAARKRVIARAEDAIAAQLVARGYTQTETAELLGSSQQTVSRRVGATLTDIVDELNGTRTEGVRIVRPERPRQTVRLLTTLAAA